MGKDSRNRSLLALAAVAAAAILLAGFAGAGQSDGRAEPPAPAAAAAVPPADDAAPGLVAHLPDAVWHISEARRSADEARAAARRRAAEARERAAERRAEERRRARAKERRARKRAEERRRARLALERRSRERSPALAAILRARRAGHLTYAEERRYRGRLWSATRHAANLEGVRRRELSSVLSGVHDLARRDQLTPGRMPAVFLQLRRNTEVWTRGRIRPAGSRIVFGGDPLVFQYVNGHGIQLHPLANFAQANKLRNACVGVNTEPGVPCRKQRLKRLLDRMLDVASRRGDFVAWEYWHPHSGGRPPWISSMSQGTGMQALARGSRLLGTKRHVRAARAALPAFLTPTPTGVAVQAGAGRRHYAMYSFAPRTKILNGFLQSISGLLTYGRMAGDERALRAYGLGDREARAILPSFDTGAWSLYSRPGRPATEEYHRLSRDFLRNLCRRAGTADYCLRDERFTRYLRKSRD